MIENLDQLKALAAKITNLNMPRAVVAHPKIIAEIEKRVGRVEMSEDDLPQLYGVPLVERTLLTFPGKEPSHVIAKSGRDVALFEDPDETYYLVEHDGEMHVIKGSLIDDTSTFRFNFFTP